MRMARARARVQHDFTAGATEEGFARRTAGSSV